MKSDYGKYDWVGLLFVGIMLGTFIAAIFIDGLFLFPFFAALFLDLMFDSWNRKRKQRIFNEIILESSKALKEVADLLEIIKKEEE